MAPPLVIESKAVNYLRAIPTFNLRKNPHRPEIALQLQDIQIDFVLRNYDKTIHFGITDTQRRMEPQFDLKLSVITNETGDRISPPLSPASEDAATSPSEIASKSYNAKRQTEVKAYLRFIKTGHETIKQLEAFHQYRDERGKLILAQFYRLCDAGTVKQIRAVYNARQKRPPEAFLWKLYYEVIDALAFLHNDHPKYENDPLHKGRRSIIMPYLDAGNIYLSWPEGGSPSYVYPDVKLGDFDAANFVEFGDGFSEDIVDKADIDYKHNPPELNWWSAKSDIWRAGSIIYSLTSRNRTTTKLAVPRDQNFADLTAEQQTLITMDPRRVLPIDCLYSGEFEAMLQRSLVLDHKKRPSARELLQELQGPATERKRNLDLFRALPEWIGEEIIPRKKNDFAKEHSFSQKRLKNLLQPGVLEAERLANRKKIIAKKKEAAERRKREVALDLLGDENPTAVELFYEEWLPREKERGNFLGRGEDEYDALEFADEVAKYIMVRSRGIDAGTWVDPGPGWQEVEKLGKEAEAAAAAPPP
ncbi:uncharacterized protein EAE97_002189 [Botrytis byssoidea]|uniref:non-specific serine/threonine protein kinase n=1 Tax=Botrytis byssoidea TaxID=139641 RepID=A0A9P5IVM1_9HELO|nr:uncharacterized protein EAE97_002189 [Botrytis byssoidea]KAF7950637.1 hypothetical protein EAE97_002189 [Botrytis byssoidea]